LPHALPIGPSPGRLGHRPRLVAGAGGDVATDAALVDAGESIVVARSPSAGGPPYPVPMAIDVLLSGFAPFDGAATNESWEAVREAVPALVARGVDAEAVELPVEFGT